MTQWRQQEQQQQQQHHRQQQQQRQHQPRQQQPQPRQQQQQLRHVEPKPPPQLRQVPIPVNDKVGQGNSCCTARRTCIGMILLILICVGGGIVLWKFLPSNKRIAVKGTLNDISESVTSATRDANASAPPAPYQFMQCNNTNTTNTQCCNGLSTICNMNISDIMFAGIHNGNAALQNGYRVAPNHYYQLEASLDYGYRAISVDVGMCNGVIKLVHGKCQLGTRDPYEVFTNINTWLDNNPTEVILMPMEINNDAGSDNDKNQLFLSDIYNILNNVSGITDKMWSIGNLGYFPKIKELIQSNQRLLFFTYNSYENCADSSIFCPPGFMDWFQHTKETDYHYTSLLEINNKTKSCIPTRGRTDGEFLTVNVFLTLPSYKVSSEVINKKSWLSNHINECSQMNNNELINVVYVDYWDEGNLPEIVQTTNIARALAIKQNRTTRNDNSLLIFNTTDDVTQYLNDLSADNINV